MGEFAQNKINEVINLIESHKKDKQTISKNQVPNLLKIVKNIGEPLLRNKLEDEIKLLFEDDITEIVNNLRNKKNEEIEKELENYSQYTQTKVLMKLLEIRK
jgi:Glu-tRNA(Gln) amidotransferase subunit E-like FAD-binding protein